MKKIKCFVILIILIYAVLPSVSSINESVKLNEYFSKSFELETDNSLDGINILVVIPNHYGAFTLHHINNYRLMGWNVTTTALTDFVIPCEEGSHLYNLPNIMVDMIISDIDNIDDFNVLSLMPTPARGNNPYGNILVDEDALNLFSNANDNNLIIWATCAGPRVLAAADIINGIKIQGSARFQSEYEEAGAIYVGNGLLPVIDGNIVTMTNGWYYNKEGCEAIETAIQNNSLLIPMLEENLFIFKEIYPSKKPMIVDNVIWEKTFGGQYVEGARYVYPTNDGGVIATGYTFSFGAGNTDIYVVKLDADGKEEWSNTYGSTGWEYGNAICQSSDDGYVVTGYINDEGFDKDVCVLKLDDQGNEQWFRSYGGSEVDVGCSICELDDSCFLICGFTESFGNGENDVYLLKITSQGEILWEKTFGGVEAERGNYLFKTSLGSVLIVGSSGSFGYEGNYDFYFINVDSDGNELWSNTYGVGGQYGYDCGYSVCETDDKGFIVVGEYALFDIGNIEVLKVDVTGEVVKRKYFGDDFLDFGTSLCKMDDGCFLICGATRTRSNEQDDILLVKIDSDLNEIWKRVIEYPGRQWGNSICMTNDGNFVFVGDTDISNFGNSDFWIVKISSVDSQPPGRPDRPSGPDSGRVGREYSYSSIGVDPDGDDIFYLFDWGDGTDSGWLGPYVSGMECTVSHIWDEENDYFIKVKLKDVHGFQSDWSDPLVVSMPKNKNKCLSNIFWFFEKSDFNFSIIRMFLGGLCK